MDTVHIVTRGEYDDYEIVGAFSDFEKAEAYANFAGNETQIESYPLDMEVPSWYKANHQHYDVFLEICRRRTTENMGRVPQDAQMPYFYMTAKPRRAPREWLDVNHSSFTGITLEQVVFLGEQVNGSMARVIVQAANQKNARAKAKSLFIAEPQLERYNKEISEIQP